MTLNRFQLGSQDPGRFTARVHPKLRNTDRLRLVNVVFSPATRAKSAHDFFPSSVLPGSDIIGLYHEIGILRLNLTQVFA
jgi:hypothetical protein